MVLIPAGEFKMGSGESAEATAAFFNEAYGEDFLTADFFKHEHPQHRVRITKPFYLGTYHVTRASSAVRRRQRVQDRRGEGEKPERSAGTRQEEFGFNEKYSWRNADSSRATSTRW